VLLTSRDLELCADIWQHRYMTTAQVAAVHWPGVGVRAPQARLGKLRAAAMLEAWDPPRPVTDDGMYLGRLERVWRIAPGGLRACITAQLVPRDATCRSHTGWSWRAVAGRLVANDVAISLLAGVGSREEWRGPVHGQLTPPAGTVDELAAARGVRAQGFRWRSPEPLRPAFTVKLALGDHPPRWTPVELVRTGDPRRIATLLLRYQLYLSVWGESDATAMLVVPGLSALRLIAQLADHALTGAVRAVPLDRVRWPARDGLWLASERDLAGGLRGAVLLPAAPTQGRWPVVCRLSMLPGATLDKLASSDAARICAARTPAAERRAA
jgi:hypothetical protein